MARARIRNDRSGEVLVGKYRLESVLGTGGMGDVYRARNEMMGRPVAIKVLHEELAENEQIVARFLREARATNIVRHPNVVDVLDVGTDDDGVPFIVQELLEGETLSQYLRRRKRLDHEEMVTLMIPVAEAVAHAHVKGVIHRDLKPANIFLARMEGTFGSTPKILDFGISKITTGDDVDMTSTGMSLGTPTHMSPEQIQGLKSLDARTDVWALGVIIYQLMAGHPPFQADSPGALFVRICVEDPA